MIILHDHELSSECYAVRLLANLAGVDYQRRLVDWTPGRETESDAFLAINPLGELPVLEAEGVLIFDWIAILTYLARRHAPAWYPIVEPLELARVAEALGIGRRLGDTLGLARRHDLFGLGRGGDLELRRADAHRLLRVLDSRLWFLEQDGCDWLAGGRQATIGDVAVFVQVAFSEDAGVGRQEYPAIRRWIDRCRRLEGFIAMGGVAPLPPIARADQLAR